MNTVKTLGEFVELVRSMRMYQDIYFKKKDAISLGMAKKYESQVDAAIAERDAKLAQKQQPELSGLSGGGK